MNKITDCIKRKLSEAKRSFRVDDIESLLWINNVIPSFWGFSLLKKEKISVFAPFWILHISLLFYVYFIGNLVYQMNYASTAGEFIKSYVNVSLLVFIANNTYWYLKEWPLIRSTIVEIRQSDELCQTSPEACRKLEKYMHKVKIVICIFYGFNFVNASLVYFPHRSDVNNEFSMTPCVGMEPLDRFPNHQICRTILYVQEVTIASVCLNWQTLLVIMIAHTAVMYDILADEMMTLNKPDVENKYARKLLPTVIKRHSLILDTIGRLKLLYSIPIGTNFISNAICTALFFILPLEEWLGFMPILIYCFVTFFLYCFLGQRLINTAEKFETAVYSCGWEKYDVKFQKSIYIMLIQSQQKVELLAADIIPVNIYTFATTLQFMYKFLTVMKF